MKPIARETVVKYSCKGDLIWTISVFNKKKGGIDEYTTTETTGKGEGKFRKCARSRTHRNMAEAMRFMNREVKFKIKQGYHKDNHRFESEEDTDEEEPDTKMTPSIETYRPPGRPSTNALDPSEGPSRKYTKRKSGSYDDVPKKKVKTMEQELVLANQRADALRRGSPMPRDSDTDSLASSETPTMPLSLKLRARIGVSPLKKRRSLRLAIKRETSTMDTTPGLPRGNTVVMMTPKITEDMETSTKWEDWRFKKQKSDNITLRKTRSNSKMDTLVHKNSLQPQLLKKQSTTACLRQMFHKAGLESKIEIPNVFANQESDHAESITGNTSAFMKRLVGRQAVSVMPSLEEAASSTESDQKQSSFSGNALKRKSKEVSGSSPQKPKRTRIEIPIEPKVFQPPRDLWPVEMNSPIVWQMPFNQESTDTGCGICFTIEGCTIATKGGKVIKLDKSVRCTSTTGLLHGVRFIQNSDKRVVCASKNGIFYDVSNSEPGLVHDLNSKSQILAFGIYDDTLYISRPKGVLLVYNLGTSESIRILTKKNLNEWIHVDNSGIYVGHTTGVNKYSLTTHELLWDKTVESGVMAGDVQNGNLYLGGSIGVLKLDKLTGEIVSTYLSNTDSTRGISKRIAVGGRMIYLAQDRIQCFDEELGCLVYVLTPPPETCTQLKFYEGRLFYISDNHLFSIDLSPCAINDTMNGKINEPVEIDIEIEAGSPSFTRKLTKNVRSLKRGAQEHDNEGPPPTKKCLLKTRALTMGSQNQ